MARPKKMTTYPKTPGSFDDLRPAHYNPRDITPEAAEGLRHSLVEFGDISGIVWNRRTGNLVCGHRRVEELREAGATFHTKHGKPYVLCGKDRFDVRVVDWDDLVEKAANITANNPHIAGEFTIDLPAMLVELKDFDPDEFASLRLDGLLDDFPPAVELDPDADAVPEPPDNPTARRGDLWTLGEHRLLCGDSTSSADVDRLLDGQDIHLVNTDPPYKVKVEPRSNNAVAAAAAAGKLLHHQKGDMKVKGGPDVRKPTTRKMRPKDRPLVNDFVSEEDFNKMLLAWFRNIARALQPGRCFYIWGGYANLGNYPPALKASELYFSQGIVWDKEHPVLNRKDFMGAFELAFYGWREGAGHKFFGPANATDIWHVKKVNPQAMIHLTEKPVELALKALEYSSRPGENVLDLFAGSGSTLMACEQAGRRAFLMEAGEAYCDVIVERWEGFTGKKAKRARRARRRKVVSK